MTHNLCNVPRAPLSDDLALIPLNCHQVSTDTHTSPLWLVSQQNWKLEQRGEYLAQGRMVWQWTGEDSVVDPRFVVSAQPSSNVLHG